MKQAANLGLPRFPRDPFKTANRIIIRTFKTSRQKEILY
jgi:hypothetical protein